MRGPLSPAISAETSAGVCRGRVEFPMQRLSRDAIEERGRISGCLPKGSPGGFRDPAAGGCAGGETSIHGRIIATWRRSTGFPAATAASQGRSPLLWTTVSTITVDGILIARPRPAAWVPPATCRVSWPTPTNAASCAQPSTCCMDVAVARRGRWSPPCALTLMIRSVSVHEAGANSRTFGVRAGSVAPLVMGTVSADSRTLDID